DGFRLRWQDPKPRIDPGGWRVQKGIEHHIAAVHGLLADPGAAQNESASLTCFALFHWPVLGVDGPNAPFQAGPADYNACPGADRGGEDGAGDSGAVTGQGEAPVHGKTEPAFTGPGCPIVERRID